MKPRPHTYTDIDRMFNINKYILYKSKRSIHVQQQFIGVFVGVGQVNGVSFIINSVKTKQTPKTPNYCNILLAIKQSTYVYQYGTLFLSFLKLIV